MQLTLHLLGAQCKCHILGEQVAKHSGTLPLLLLLDGRMQQVGLCLRFFLGRLHALRHNTHTMVHVGT